ncbi:MAG: phospholipase D-like domain-containing protein, partial [Candidatus Dormibacteria bacterium]
MAVTGCGAAPSASPTTASGPTSHKVMPATPLSLLIEPDAGLGPLYEILGSAQHSVDLIMYELEDSRAEQLLANDAGRLVDVRVVLNSAVTFSVNAPAYSYLVAHGVHVRRASPSFALTHQKTLIVDGSVAVIMTLNWTSRYYSDTRDV